MSKMQPVRGTHDLFRTSLDRHKYIEATACTILENYGFEEMRSPIFEFTEVFTKSIGEDTDVVGKEMYQFIDRGGDSITLRPEGTAAIVRSFLSNSLTREIPLKVYYHGPMFRYERPQKGRQRQFHSIGVEILGSASPLSDVDCIACAQQFLHALGFKDLIQLELNTIGDHESRIAYKKKLVEYLEGHKDNLSEDSQKRLQTNPLRVLDSKDKKDQEIVTGAPLMMDSLNESSKEFYNQLKSGLNNLDIDFIENQKLVRGLDYYEHTVFEFTTTHLGAQGTVLGGGRYNSLVEMMGGPDCPGVGWGSGMERIELLLKENAQPETKRSSTLIPMGELAEQKALKICYQLREQGFKIEMCYSGNMNKRMKKANKRKSRYALILGDEELKDHKILLKDLDSGEQNLIEIDAIRDYLI